MESEATPKIGYAIYYNSPQNALFQQFAAMMDLKVTADNTVPDPCEGGCGQYIYFGAFSREGKYLCEDCYRNCGNPLPYDDTSHVRLRNVVIDHVDYTFTFKRQLEVHEITAIVQKIARDSRRAKKQSETTGFELASREPSTMENIRTALFQLMARTVA